MTQTKESSEKPGRFSSPFPMPPGKQQGNLWLAPPRLLNIEQNEVHLWRVPLIATGPGLCLFHAMLSPDENLRADRFRFEKDRLSYLVSHGALRQILGAYVKVDPAQLEFENNDQGKPYLKKGAGSHPIQFNLSHSHDFALIAVTFERAVGIDLEHAERNIEMSDISRHFSPAESELLAKLPAPEQKQAFYNCWTRKEAYIKARGDALAYDLNQFEVSLKPGEPARLISNKEDPEEVSRWRMEDVNVASGYAAAIVVEGCDWELYHWCCNGPSRA